MEKTRIILITNAFPFGKGEASFIVPEIVYLLKFFDVTIVSRNSKDEQTTIINEKIDIFRYNAKRLSLISFLCSARYLFNKSVLKQLIQKKKQCMSIIKFVLRGAHIGKYLCKIRKRYNQSVIYYTYWNDYAAYGVSRFCKKNADKVISRIHGGDLYLRPTNGYFLPFKAEMADMMDQIVFISNDGKNYFINTYKPNNTGNLSVMHMGVDNSFGIGRGSEDEILRIVSLSNVTFGKRVDLIVKALALLENIRVEWVHFGDGEEMLKLQEIVKILDSKQNIQYKLAGQVSNKEVKEYLANNLVDLLVNVSYSEGLPVSMMEAASFGIPIIATNVGGVKEIVSSENGFLLNRDFDVRELSELLTKYYFLSQSSKNSMRKASRHIWEKKFNAEKNYLTFARMLKTL